MIQINDDDLPIMVAEKIIYGTKPYNSTDFIGNDHANNMQDMFDIEEIKEIADYLMVYYQAHQNIKNKYNTETEDKEYEIVDLGNGLFEERRKIMTLDEAIKHSEEIAEEQEKMAKEWHENQIRKCKLIPFAEMDYTHENECKKCAEEQRQLVKWLKELKLLREQCTLCKKCEKTESEK